MAALLFCEALDSAQNERPGVRYQERRGFNGSGGAAGGGSSSGSGGIKGSINGGSGGSGGNVSGGSGGSGGSGSSGYAKPHLYKCSDVCKKANAKCERADVAAAGGDPGCVSAKCVCD